MSDIAVFENALREWREAQARVDALVAFQANGGDFRLRMRTDNNDPVIGGLMDDMLQNGGYASVLRNTIKVASDRAQKAEQHFVQLAATAHSLPEQISGQLKAAFGGRP